jgi:hypothetical protein
LAGAATSSSAPLKSARPKVKGLIGPIASTLHATFFMTVAVAGLIHFGPIYLALSIVAAAVSIGSLRDAWLGWRRAMSAN